MDGVDDWGSWPAGLWTTGLQICNGHFLTFLLQEKGRPKKINEGGKGRKQIKVNIEKVPLAMYG